MFNKIVNGIANYVSDSVNNKSQNSTDEYSAKAKDENESIFGEKNWKDGIRDDLKKNGLKYGLGLVDAICNSEDDNLQTVDKFADNENKADDKSNSKQGNLAQVKGVGQDLLGVIGDKIDSGNIIHAIGESTKVDGFPNVFQKFGEVLINDATIETFNDALNPKKKGEISDAQLSNVHEYNGLTNKDMLLLNSIAYSDFATIENKDKTLGEITKELKQVIKETGVKKAFDKSGNITATGVQALKDTGYDIGVLDNETFANMLNEILSKDELSALTILDNTDESDNGIIATTYGRLDSDGKLIGNATVIFQGTEGSEGWKDNAESMTEETTKMQKAAYNYVKSQEEVLKDKSNNSKEIHLTVSGHSKGGNLAMYSIVENTKDTSSSIVVDNCLPFNSQGLNDEYVENNEKAIDE